MIKSHQLNLQKLGPLGAEIIGLDLSEPLDKTLLESIKHKLLEHLVLVFRNQNLTLYNLLKVSKFWGRPLKHPVFSGIDGNPEIIRIQNYGKKYHTNAHWHSDVTFEEYPPDITLLYAVQVPDQGGNTLFSNQYLAYEALSDWIKKTYKKSKALHSNKSILKLTGGNIQNCKSVLHPIFREHPETNKKALYVTEAFVEGIDGIVESESSKLLKTLYKIAKEKRFRYEHKWEKEDLVVWDNRCVQHYAVHDYGDEMRTMYRITVG